MNVVDAPYSEVSPTSQILLDQLSRAGKLDEAGSRRAIAIAQSTRESLIAVLHQLALVDDEAVAAAASNVYGIPLCPPALAPEAALAIDGLSTAFLRHHRVLPLGWQDGALCVGLVDPERREALAALGFAARCATVPLLLSFGEWRQRFAALYGDAPEAAELEHISAGATASWTDDAARIRDQSDAAPAVHLVNALLDRALEAGASDIHVEPMADRVRIRFRTDGALSVVAEEPPQLAGPIAARIKILADMDVANRRAPQDGRTSLAARGRPIDVRISTIPSTYGETVALRLLRRDPALLNLDKLGFSPRVRAILDRVLRLRRGIFLVTGPTGSGKTTTLYAMLERLRAQSLKILSIEDPIEYFFSDVTQTQVNEDAGVTFATALRAFLRQDPDVILIGEIRDVETARTAAQAALTGHLVLSTLHTNDSASAATRLADIGLDRYLISATLAGVMSQRLIARACPACQDAAAPTAAEQALLARLGAPSRDRIVHSRGCAECRQTGQRGRLAVAEAFFVSDDIRAGLSDPGGQALAKALRADGFASFTEDAARRLATGEAALVDVAALSEDHGES